MRQNNFDLIRCAMAILVIFSHSYAIIHGKGTIIEPMERWTGGAENFGGFAVNVFFILSGFLIAMSWERSSSTYDYLKRRVFRIYPGFAMAMLFCALVIAPLFVLQPPPTTLPDGSIYQAHYDGISWRLMKNYIFSTITLHEHWVPGVFLHNPLSNYLNSSVWTIRFEFGCYLLILVLGLLRVLRNRWAVLAFFVIAQGAMILQRWFGLAKPAAMQELLCTSFNIQPENYIVFDRWFGPIVQWPGLVTMFTAGILFYAWRDRIPKRSIYALIAFALLCAVMLCCGSEGHLGLAARPLVPALEPLTLTYVVFWAAFQPYLSFPRFARYGDFSYGIYLYAFPVQQALKATMGERMQSATFNFLLATPITILLAIGSWYGVERHFIKRKNKSSHVEDHGFRATPPVPEVTAKPGA